MSGNGTERSSSASLCPGTTGVCWDQPLPCSSHSLQLAAALKSCHRVMRSVLRSGSTVCVVRGTWEDFLMPECMHALWMSLQADSFSLPWVRKPPLCGWQGWYPHVCVPSLATSPLLCAVGRRWEDVFLILQHQSTRSRWAEPVAESASSPRSIFGKGEEMLEAWSLAGLLLGHQVGACCRSTAEFAGWAQPRGSH